MGKDYYCEASAYAGNTVGEKRPARVLLLDDNVDAVTLLNVFLQGQGFEVISATNAESAYTQILAGSPDLMITDHTMPETSGLDLCHRIRSDDRIQQFPIIMHTACGIDSLRSAVYDEFIPKPVDLHQLLRSIQKLLTSHFCRTACDLRPAMAAARSARAPRMPIV